MRIWDEEAVEALKDLWEVEQKTCSEIALMMQKMTGQDVSRNAVIGKIQRLNLTKRTAGQRSKIKKKKPRTRKKRMCTSEVKKTANTAYSNKMRTMATIEPGECRWPIGDPKSPEFHFCGADAIRQRPYCEKHANISNNHKPFTVETVYKNFGS